MADQGYFCNKPLKPWIILLVVLTVFLIGWIVLQKEELLLVGEIESPQREASLPTAEGEPVFPGPVKAAAFPNPYPPSQYGVAAITKATPNGSVQLVANPSHTGFQETLKDAVNAIIPSVCDIHAMWIGRSGKVPRYPNSQVLQFIPPFDGNVDKFIQNKGYENIGAGVIVDKRGYVLTNYHVVQDAKNIVVTVPGNPGKDYSARVVAHEIDKDMALLKIKANTIFPEARLGDSGFSQIGDYVIAVGSPFGMEQTVTSGIVSGKRKSVKIDGIRYKNLLQTDAPVNRGSSGGPLVNLSGEVIGITTAIYAPTGVFSGTGFAIPINGAKEFLSNYLGRSYPVRLDRRGMVRDPIVKSPPNLGVPLPVLFGIEAVSLDRDMAHRLGAGAMGGVLVNRVFANSPASFAGIARGDILTSIAGVPTGSTKDVSRIVSHFRQGDKVNMRIVRNGRMDEVLVKLR